MLRRCGGALSTLESEGLNHCHVDWIELGDESGGVAFGAELQALQSRSVDAVYVRGVAGMAMLRAMQARILFDIGAQPDQWLRRQRALLTAVVSQDSTSLSSMAADVALEDDRLRVVHDLKHFLLRWELITRRNAEPSVVTGADVL